jgi:hypothetical protein
MVYVAFLRGVNVWPHDPNTQSHYNILTVLPLT